MVLLLFGFLVWCSQVKHEEYVLSCSSDLLTPMYLVSLFFSLYQGRQGYKPLKSVQMVICNFSL